MFLKEALLQCSILQQETARLYEAVARTFPGPGSSGEWDRASGREQRRAAFLVALASLFSALDVDGPFVVGVPSELDSIRRVLELAAWRHSACGNGTPCDCGKALARASSDQLHANLLEIAEPELRRAVRKASSEIRSSLRAAGGQSPPGDQKIPSSARTG